MKRVADSFIPGIILLAVLACATDAYAAGTKFMQWPNYRDGNVVFTYKGDIWLQPASGAARPLTWHSAVDTRPMFSPDGKWIAFSSSRTGNWEVFVMPATGGMPRQLTHHSGSDVVVAWASDGKRIIFQTRRGSLWGGNLYTVDLDGNLPEVLIPVRSSGGTISGDGKLFAYTQRGSSYSRKGYKGSTNAKIFIFDLESRKVRRLLETDMHENSPIICGDKVYYACEADGVFNLWRVPLASGTPEQVTKHKENGVSHPSMPHDGKVIVYEHDFNIWKLDVATGESEIVPIELSADYREAPVEHKTLKSCESFDVSPDGTRVVVETHGEIFTVPVDKGRVVQITDSPARDRYPKYSPDGKKIAFISDMSGREEVFLIESDGKSIEQITDVDARKRFVSWSPDGKKLAVSMSDHTLRIYDMEKETLRILLKHKELALSSLLWSPDGKWVAYLKPNRDLMGDVCIASAVDENPEEHVIIEDMPLDEYLETFTSEKLFFLAETTVDGDRALYSVSLAKELEDPDDPEVKAAKKKKKPSRKKPEKKPKKEGDEDKEKEEDGEKTDKEEGEKPEGEEKEGEEKEEESEIEKKEPELPEVKVDFDRIEKRVEKLFQPEAELRGAAISPDGKAVVLLVREDRAEKPVDVLYRYTPDSEKSKLLSLGSASGIRGLRFSSDGKKLFYMSNGVIFHRSASPASPKPVSFSLKVKIDAAREMAQIFHEVWRVMKHTFHDPKMHGVDWIAVRDKYAAVLPSVTDRDTLDVLINLMLGELNASHMGYYGAGDERPSYSTMSPGFELEADAASGRYRIAHIYEDGPATKDWANVSEGDYLISIDGREVKAGDNYYEILNHPLNERVDLVLSPNPDGTDNRTTRIKLISGRELYSLRYYEWVKANRKRVEEISGGRLAYVHIPSMSGRSLTRFKREIVQYRLHEGLIIDVRNNGGGNIDQQLLDVLERKAYGFSVLRDASPVRHHRLGFFGVKCVIHNEFSFSDAEVFPAGFRDLGLGRLIGMPTGGGVIGTSGHRLIDGSYMRTPRWSYFDAKGTNLENLGVKPDIMVDLTPEDELAVRYPQLDRAIGELMKLLPPEPPKPLERPK
ncbi:MAG: S41 family peptidase [Planctomycetota bacterium]|jgi:tricorn protease